MFTAVRFVDIHYSAYTSTDWDGVVCPTPFGLVVEVSSHESATFRGGGSQFRGRVVRLALRHGLVDLCAPHRLVWGHVVPAPQSFVSTCFFLLSWFAPRFVVRPELFCLNPLLFSVLLSIQVLGGP